MRSIIIALLLSFAASNMFAQYTLYKEIEGVQFHTKWGNEKWYSKKSPKILMVKIINKSSTAAEFTLGIEFFTNLIMIEESAEKPYCVSAGKTLLPRVAGLAFKPAKANPESLDSFELTGLEIEKLATTNCKQQ